MAVYGLHVVDKQLEELSHSFLTFDYEVYVPPVSHLQSDTVPCVEWWVTDELLLVHQEDVLSQHPESGCEWTIDEAFDVRKITA